jgi:hypothetical protein
MRSMVWDANIYINYISLWKKSSSCALSWNVATTCLIFKARSISARCKLTSSHRLTHFQLLSVNTSYGSYSCV